jgi:hypothetical protein
MLCQPPTSSFALPRNPHSLLLKMCMVCDMAVYAVLRATLATVGLYLIQTTQARDLGTL